jgi:hypothetical protein
MGKFDNNRLSHRIFRVLHPCLWATLLSTIFGFHCPAATFIGNPSAANGWSTTNAVKVRAGHERTSPPSLDSRLAISTIDGSGLDAAGEIHSVDQTEMWLSQSYSFQGNPPIQRGGTVAGGHWIEFAFDRSYPIDEMLIWNYAEHPDSLNPNGSRKNYFWAAEGMRQVTIQYSAIGGGGPSGLWGSDDSNQWQTVFSGDLAVYNPGEFNVANNAIHFDGASAQYVVITSSTDPLNMNWIAEKIPASFPDLNSGLSEVRFLLQREFKSVTINPAVYYQRPSVTQNVYQLFGRDSPFTNDWYEIGTRTPGSGNPIFGFEKGRGPPWLPSRAWCVSQDNDGYSLGFDGADDFAIVGHDDALNLTGGMTLEAWVKPADTGTEGTILVKASSSVLASYGLILSAAGRAVLGLYDSSGGMFVDLETSAGLDTNVWTHIAATYDAVTASILVNGLVDASVSATGVVRVSTLSPLVVGSIFGVNAFSGQIDEVRVWDHARSDTQILNSMGTKIVGNENGLIAYWQMKEPASQVALDSTSRELDLVLGSSILPDAFDPEWVGESFPGSVEFQEIFEFGTSWFSICWDTRPEELYDVEVTSSLSPGSWTSLVEHIPGTGGPVDYYELPTDVSADPSDSLFYRILGPATSNTNLAQGLVAHFPFNGNAMDESGNGNDGTVSGSSPVPDRFGAAGRAYSFDGIDDYIRVSGSSDFDLSALTVSVWIRADDFMSAKSKVVLSTLINTFADGGFQIHNSAGNVSFSYRTVTGGSFSVTTSQVFTPADDGTWHHVAGTYDYDGTNSIVHVYVDGLPRTSDVRATTLIAYDLQDLLIGLNYDSTAVGGSLEREFEGSIDEIRIYDRVLSSNEVWQLFGHSE